MSEELRAREMLRAMGIQKPSATLIEDWIRANRAEQEPPEDWLTPPPPARPPSQCPAPSPEVQNLGPKRPRGYSKSNLEPVLREQGTLGRQHDVRKPGRPRVVASFFPALARTMADGTSLREALKRHGITLDKLQIRALYRSSEFKRLYQEARHRHQHSDLYFKKSLSREERFRRML
jgi:hypothetical protein